MLRTVPYSPSYKEDFIRLNKEWITKYFKLEEGDIYLFNHIEDYLKNGSEIFFTVNENNQVISTCMIEKKSNDVYEINKLATDSRYTGLGGGKKVMLACINYVKEHKGKIIKLVSNTRLLPALHLYTELGFNKVPLEKEYFGFERGNIQYELRLD